MPKHDDPEDPNNVVSLREMEEAAAMMPDGPEKVARLKHIAELRQVAALHSAVRRELRDRGSTGLDPAPFPKDYPDE